MNARLKANPELQLLIEPEPAHRIFLSNLSDALSKRTSPPTTSAYRAAPFWKDVFVDSGLPWGAFMESMLWHIAIVSVLWTVSQTWIKQEQIQQRRLAHQSLTYYPPPKNFPALHARPPRTRERSSAPQNPAQPALQVAHERDHSPLKPPDVKFSRNHTPDILAAQSSAVPLFAPKLRQGPIPQVPALALAPATDIGVSTNRRLNLPQASAVAPPASVGSLSGRRAMPSTDSAVVAPAPRLQATMSRSSGAGVGDPQVVQPAPQLNGREQNGILARESAPLARPAVVAPTASANGAGMFGSRRLTARVASAVVPPSPSAVGAGNSARGKSPTPFPVASAIAPSPSIGAAVGRSGGSNSVSGGPVRAVPPSPSGTGNSIGGLRISSLAAAGSPLGTTAVVPPPASIAGQSLAGAGRAAPLSGSGSRAVPPPPSAGGTGNMGGSQRASLGNGAQAVLQPAPPSLDTHTASANPQSPVVSTAIPPPPDPSGPNVPASIELPIRVIGEALSLPNSSYFSNYEVFIAERRLKKGDPELIKLVYVSLPYQPRLAEYGLDNSKVYRLRVTRDPACDETLLQMTWPQTDPSHSGSKYATGPPALGPNDKNSLLPCYRTTADDYRIAITRGH